MRWPFLAAPSDDGEDSLECDPIIALVRAKGEIPIGEWLFFSFGV
jgi:hypothetical protein